MSHWAAPYVGKPWVSGAAGPESYDCWGLVRAVYRERFGIELAAIDVDAHAPIAVRHAAAGERAGGGWQTVDGEAVEGDVVLMGQARHPHHVGVHAAGGVLHAVEGAGVVFQGYASLARHGWRILGLYRRAA